MQNTTGSMGKMTLTLSSKKYSELLVKYQPKLIKTEEENEKAHRSCRGTNKGQNLTEQARSFV